MPREFFKNLPNTTTPLTAPRLNGLLDGDEAMGNVIVESANGKNLFNKDNEAFSTNNCTYTSLSTGFRITNSTAGTYRYAAIRVLDLNDFAGQKLTLSCAMSGNGYKLVEVSRATFSLESKTTFGDLDTSHLTKTIDVPSIATMGTSHYLFLRAYSAGSSSIEANVYTDYTDFQIERGEIKTSYSDYQVLGYTSGSNANGNYVKYDDGTLIQYGSVEASANTNYGTINFPIAFIDTDYELLVNHKYRGGADYGGSAQIRCITTGQVSTTSLGYVYSVYSDGTSPSYKRNCTYYAIGKWK